MGKHKKISIDYIEQPIDELHAEDKNLLQMAKEMCNKAYAPYSDFNVGAAVLMANGKIVTGNNQENAAYPSGICAERTAMFKASADYPDIEFKTIAIAAKSGTIEIKNPVSPCGACRQVMKEYENKFKNKIRVILSGEKSDIVYIIESIENLLPFSFKSDDIEK